jgi:hypothetical protein
MSEYTIETFTHEGLECSIYADIISGNPYREWDQVTEVIWIDREYADKKDLYRNPDYFNSVAHMQRYLTLMDKYLAAIPFRFEDYGSGGMRAYLVEYDTDRSATGFIVLSKERCEKFGCDPADAEEIVKQDFKPFKVWAQGEILGYYVEADDDSDGCAGFYDDIEYVRKECKESAERIKHEILVNQEPTDIAEVLA